MVSIIGKACAEWLKRFLPEYDRVKRIRIFVFIWRREKFSLISQKMKTEANGPAKRPWRKDLLPFEKKQKVIRGDLKENEYQIHSVILFRGGCSNPRYCATKDKTMILKNVGIFFTTAAKINAYSDSSIHSKPNSYYSA